MLHGFFSSEIADTYNYRNQIENLEKVMAGYKSQLQKTCGDQDYDVLNEKLRSGIEEAKRFESVLARCISDHPVDLKTRKSTGTRCQIEIHFSIQIIKFFMKCNSL